MDDATFMQFFQAMTKAAEHLLDLLGRKFIILGKQIRQGAALYVLLNNSGAAFSLSIKINLRTYRKIILL